MLEILANILSFYYILSTPYILKTKYSKIRHSFNFLGIFYQKAGTRREREWKQKRKKKGKQQTARHRWVKVWFYLVWFGFRVSWNYPRPGSIVLERERCAAAFDCSLDICVRSAEILICVVGQGMPYFPGQPVRFRFYSLSLLPSLRFFFSFLRQTFAFCALSLARMATTCLRLARWSSPRLEITVYSVGELELVVKGVMRGIDRFLFSIYDIDENQDRRYFM